MKDESWFLDLDSESNSEEDVLTFGNSIAPLKPPPPRHPNDFYLSRDVMEEAKNIYRSDGEPVRNDNKLRKTLRLLQGKKNVGEGRKSVMPMLHVMDETTVSLFSIISIVF